MKMLVVLHQTKSLFKLYLRDLKEKLGIPESY